MSSQGTEMLGSKLFGQGEDLFVLPGVEDGSLFQKQYPKLRILVINGLDWNRDLSPWQADKVFKGGENFAGQADHTIAYIEEVLSTQAPIHHCWIAGYSLAGLFALYACTKTDRFTGVASVSGSLWYPGFKDYLNDHPVHAEQIYLSLGENEPHTKNPVLKQVGSITEELAESLGKTHEVTYELNPGGHFEDDTGRMMKGITWLLQKDQKR
jgi:predicted alpha/beta superfamily hydrolase